MENLERLKVTGKVTHILPIKHMKGNDDNYTISAFAMDVNFGGKVSPVVFSAFKMMGAIVDTFKVGDHVKVEYYPESRIFEDGNHRTTNKVTWVGKIPK